MSVDDTAKRVTKQTHESVIYTLTNQLKDARRTSKKYYDKIVRARKACEAGSPSSALDILNE